MAIVLREARRQDETLIFSFLVLAARMPEGGEPLQKALADPRLRKYWADWGRPGDFGVVAEDSSTGIPVGCAWVRLFSKEEAGACFCGEGVPELAMGVAPGFPANGIGEKTLRRLIEIVRPRYRAICLSVRNDNPAVRLYERLSFERVPGSQTINRVGTESYAMRLNL